jgi:hypothetical protein
MSEVGPSTEGGLIQVKAAPAPVEPRSPEARLARPVPEALTWLGAALAFAGREIVPRVAASLLDAWDRRADRSTPLPNDSRAVRPTQQPTADLPTRGGRRHRRQRRGS